MSSLNSIVSGKNRISDPLSGCRLNLHNAIRLQYLANLEIIFRLFYVIKNNSSITSLYKVFLLLSFIFFSSNSYLYGQFAGGNGSLQDPYQIQNWEQLSKVNQKPNAYFIQIADLDAMSPGYGALAGPQANSGKGWIPVSNFKGRFSGNGYAIKDLFINQPLS